MASSLVSLVVLTVLSSPLVATGKPDPLIKVSEENWRNVLEGEWMVEFMAPWCPACRSFQSAWQGLAEWSRDLDISVGQIDVTENPGLSGRFMVTSLPTIMHVKDGEFRFYSGPRKESDLLAFVDDKKWKDVNAVSSWVHPNTFQMGAVGFFFKAAMVVRNFYTMLTSEYGIPEWACYIIFGCLTIVLGLLLGLMFVLCCDFFYPPKYIPNRKTQMAKEIEEKDNDSDLVEEATADHEDLPRSSRDDSVGDTGVRRRQPGITEDLADGPAVTDS